MSAPLDLDAIRARAYGGRWARDVLALLAEVERLRAEVEEWKQAAHAFPDPIIERLRATPCPYTLVRRDGTKFCALAADSVAEVERLRAEVRRLQRALIDADVLTHCEDLCMIVCAGPCQGATDA